MDSFFTPEQLDVILEALGLGEGATSDDVVQAVVAMTTKTAAANRTAATSREVVALAKIVGKSPDCLVDVACRLGARADRPDEVVGKLLAMLQRYEHAAAAVKAAAAKRAAAAKPAAKPDGLTARQRQICREAKCDPAVFAALKGGAR